MEDFRIFILIDYGNWDSRVKIKNIQWITSLFLVLVVQIPENPIDTFGLFIFQYKIKNIKSKFHELINFHPESESDSDPDNFMILLNGAYHSRPQNVSLVFI